MKTILGVHLAHLGRITRCYDADVLTRGQMMPDDEIPTDGVAQTELADEIAAHCDRATARWSALEAKIAARAAGKKAFRFLDHNSRHYDENGVEKKGAWFPDMPPANTPRQQRSRIFALEAKAFENGLRHMLDELILEGHIEEKHWSNLDYAISYKTMAFHHERVLVHDAYPGEEIPSSLASLAKRFGYKSGGWRVRNRMFPIMSDLGLWKINRKENSDEWEIRLGVVADIFHDTVFFPITEKFQEKMKGCVK